MDNVFDFCRAEMRWGVDDFTRDPVFTMVVHTFAYGLQEQQLSPAVLDALNAYQTLKEAVVAVGRVPYAIRGLVAAPMIYPLRLRRRREHAASHPATERTERAVQDDMVTQGDPALEPYHTLTQSPVSQRVSSAVSVAPAPLSTNSVPQWSPPMTMTDDQMLQVSLEALVLAEDDVVETIETDAYNADAEEADVSLPKNLANEQEDTDFDMMNARMHLPTPPFTPEAPRGREHVSDRLIRGRRSAAQSPSPVSSFSNLIPKKPKLWDLPLGRSPPLSPASSAENRDSPIDYAHTTSSFANNFGNHRVVDGFGPTLDAYARQASIHPRDIWVPSGLSSDVEHGHVEAWLEGHRREHEKLVHESLLREEYRIQEEIRKAME
jgi:hypothetical protein